MLSIGCNVVTSFIEAHEKIANLGLIKNRKNGYKGEIVEICFQGQSDLYLVEHENCGGTKACYHKSELMMP